MFFVCGVTIMPLAGNKTIVRYVCRKTLADERYKSMTLTTLLIVVLLLMVVGALPSWPHSRGWGYYPSGGMGLVLVVILILLLTGRI